MAVAGLQLRHVRNRTFREFLMPCRTVHLLDKKNQLGTTAWLLLKTSSQSSRPAQLSALTNQPNHSEDKGWEIYASICMERKPQITKDFTSMESKYSKFLAEYELETSHRSNHELRHVDDGQLLEKIKTGEIDSGNIQTAQDFEDQSNAEMLTYNLSSRKTDADEKNDVKSLDRALDSHVVFVVEQKLGNRYEWICPQLKVEGSETLRQTANRILQEICPNVRYDILGNAPWGYYHYRYPKGLKNEKGEDVTGAKVFFYKVNYLQGIVAKPNSKIIEVNDFLWLTRDELKAKLREKYHHRISQFLVPDY